MIKIETKGLTSHFSSLKCPSCDTTLEPHYHNNSTSPSYYFCQEKSAPYKKTPHYKYFNVDGYGYEVFLIWINPSSGNMYSVKRNFYNDSYEKVELTYFVEESGGRGTIRKPVTRIFTPEEFEIDPKDLAGLKNKIEKFVEIAEIFK